MNTEQVVKYIAGMMDRGHSREDSIQSARETMVNTGDCTEVEETINGAVEVIDLVQDNDFIDDGDELGDLSDFGGDLCAEVQALSDEEIVKLNDFFEPIYLYPSQAPYQKKNQLKA